MLLNHWAPCNCSRSSSSHGIGNQLKVILLMSLLSSHICHDPSFFGTNKEVSSLLLSKLVAAGIGDRPVVFVTHSMGGLVVKQILYQAKMIGFSELVNNTIGVVFYSCPHFGSKLADMPWRMCLVFRPAPSIGELRSGSPRLVELNDFIRGLHNKGIIDVLSFSETQVTPIVEGYGGWVFRLEIVPVESAYPGFDELVKAGKAKLSLVHPALIF